MTEDGGVSKYKHLLFGSKKSQKFLKSLESPAAKVNSKGLLKSVVNSAEKKHLFTDSSESTYSTLLPPVSKASSKSRADIFKLEDIFTPEILQSLDFTGKKFCKWFNKKSTDLGAENEDVSVSDVLEAMEIQPTLNPYIAMKLDELFKISNLDKHVFYRVCGLYCFLNILMNGILFSWRSHKRGDDPLKLLKMKETHGFYPASLVKYFYDNYCCQEINCESGILENSMPRERVQRNQIHLIIFIILVQAVIRKTDDFCLESAHVLMKHLNVHNFQMASLCKEIGLGAKYDNESPDQLSIYIKAPLVSVKKYHSNRRR